MRRIVAIIALLVIIFGALYFFEHDSNPPATDGVTFAVQHMS